MRGSMAFDSCTPFPHDFDDSRFIVPEILSGQVHQSGAKPNGLHVRLQDPESSLPQRPLYEVTRHQRHSGIANQE